jgi:hypothetical protein
LEIAGEGISRRARAATRALDPDTSAKRLEKDLPHLNRRRRTL